MMINKRLINTAKDTKKYISIQVIANLLSLIANIVVMFTISNILYKTYLNELNNDYLIQALIVILLMIVVRYLISLIINKMAYYSSKVVKVKFRNLIFDKLLRLGPNYNEKIKTSEVVQLISEGVEQLEIYFGQYLPQLFYAILGPIILFIVISQIHFMTAFVLFICVPLIPITIIIIQKWAKRLLSKYWGEYTKLGDTFLENLQGLVTTKIYGSDEYKHQQMNEESERFRIITMKVLMMQLNSITVMDIVAYGASAIGIIMAIIALNNGQINISEAIFIILISADFFLPMRLLGSYFHIAMNGMAASDKMFNLLDIKEDDKGLNLKLSDYDITLSNLSFAYDEEKEILHNINLDIKKGDYVAIVGESGSGKSTIASLLVGKYQNFKGDIKYGDISIKDLDIKDLMSKISYVGFNSYIFKGTIKDNLLMANPNAKKDEMLEVLKEVNLLDFLNEQDGLDTKLNERGSNLSGGQRQRLALARALLRDSEIYIFDEATSNIDVESEELIMSKIEDIAKTKTVILISHRLANVMKTKKIFVLEKGSLKESGCFKELIDKRDVFYKLWNSQNELESFMEG